MFVFVLLTNILFSQNVTIDVTLLHNTMNRVELRRTHGADQDSAVVKAQIVDDHFVIKTQIPETDIYSLYFPSKQSFLICLSPGDKVKLTVEATNMQYVPAASGSEAVTFTKQLTDVFVNNKHVLDSLNATVQKDPKQLFFTSFLNNFKPYHTSYANVGEDMKAVLEHNDSLLALNALHVQKNSVNKKSADVYMSAAVKEMKVLKNYYASYQLFSANVDPNAPFKTMSRINGYDSFFLSLTSYISTSDDNVAMIGSLFDEYVSKMSELLDIYDDAFYDGRLDQTKAKMDFCNRVANVIDMFGSKAAYSKESLTASFNIVNTMGENLLATAQENVQQIVSGYQRAFNDYSAKSMSDARALMVEHKSNLATLMFLDNFPQDKALQGEVLTALHEKYPTNELVADRWAKYDTPQNRTATGNIAPELSFPDPQGNIRNLSDLRGKVVLVDFWASWCGPCRRENPHVVEMYAKYHDKGFEVFSVSLDKDATAWKGAIAKDNLSWPNHVSDLKGWSSKAAAIYGVSSIPCTFLLDREGHILARGLRGDALTQALQQIFGE